MFDKLDTAIFDDPQFKEDSVREAVILPILTRLGFRISGADRIVRSKTLTHPFIHAGTRKLPVKMIPDYTLLCDEKPVFILDAKSPMEDVTSRDNIQQVYSYCVHPEIKCQQFGLCNGRELIIFSTDSSTPCLHLKFEEFASNWEKIEKFLGPLYLRNPTLRDFAPDLGLAIERLGVREGFSVNFLPASLNLIARLDDKRFTSSANMEFGGIFHCVSMDFKRIHIRKIINAVPAVIQGHFEHALKTSPFMAFAELAIEVDIETTLGPKTMGEHEPFRPFIVKRVLGARFNPHALTKPAAEDLPQHAFRLRDYVHFE
ncbi:type I restriction enzyme HsdR N-terminal domain-containing protein [Phreatobacter cathodiphilus]|uniref:Uncharacterized protein n=1 Tax=Phreatobacter cathodiphilus TaxID=1868589 RepID=A0A2S0NBD0_9HYPH|nr:type I restriction enzyme HsdR N-terminal domain-containing protein [Phreatobacter cathodiphilus]AVO45460.1 hypothetical protein C6569_10515 [Phreatobacter cathodiphilus]